METYFKIKMIIEFIIPIALLGVVGITSIVVLTVEVIRNSRKNSK